MSSLENVNSVQCTPPAISLLQRSGTSQVLYVTTIENVSTFDDTVDSHRSRIHEDKLNGRRVQEISSGKFNDVNSRIRAQFFDKIVLRGHGTEKDFILSSTTGGTIYLGMQGAELEEIKTFCSHVKPGGVLILESCSSGAETDNVLRFIAELCPEDVCVIGSRLTVGYYDPRGKVDPNSSSIINYAGLLRHFRFMRNLTEEDVTRIYYKSSHKVQNIPIKQLDFLYDFFYNQETQTKGGLRDDDDYFTSDHLYELALKAMGERNNAEGMRAVKEAFKELLKALFGDIYDPDAPVCDLDSPIKLLMRKEHLKKSEVSPIWQALLTDLESHAADYGHDANNCQLEMLPDTHQELVSKGTIYVPGKTDPYVRIYQFFLGCAYIDKFKPLFMLLDNEKDLVDNPGIMSACALGGFAFHGVGTTPFSVVLESFFQVVKDSYRAHQKRGNTKAWFQRYVDMEICFNNIYQSVYQWQAIDKDMYKPEEDIVRVLQGGSITNLYRLMEDEAPIDYYSSVIVDYIFDQLLAYSKDAQTSLMKVKQFFMLQYCYRSEHFFHHYLDFFLNRALDLYRSRPTKYNIMCNRLFQAILSSLTVTKANESSKIKIAKQLLDFRMAVFGKSIDAGDAFTVSVLGRKFVAGIIRTLRQGAKFYYLDDFLDELTRLAPASLIKAGQNDPIVLSIDQIGYFFKAGIDNISDREPGIKKLFRYISKSLMINAIKLSEKFNVSIKAAINKHTARGVYDVFVTYPLPERANKIVIYQTLFDYAYIMTNNRMIYVELIQGFNLSIEALSSRLIFGFLKVLSNHYKDITDPMQKDIDEMGIKYGKDFRAIGIDFDWINQIDALEDTASPATLLPHVEDVFCNYAKVWDAVTGRDTVPLIKQFCEKLKHKGFEENSLIKFKHAITELCSAQSIEVLKAYVEQKAVIAATMKQYKAYCVSELKVRLRLDSIRLYALLTQKEKHPLAPPKPTRSSKRQRT